MRAQHDFPVLVLTAHDDNDDDNVHNHAIQQLTAAADLDRHSHDLHYLPASPAANWPSILYEPSTPPPLSAPAKRLSFLGASDSSDPCFVRPRTPADRSTQHWLLNGRPPSKKPTRHRHKLSLTLPLTVDCASPIRSLTHDTPAAAVHDAEEDASMGPAPPVAEPGSVPDLTESKSSKSSSFRSSDADDATIPDLSHFEDIGLDDAPRRAAEGPHKPAAQRPGLRRTSGPAAVAGRNHAPAMRELVNGALRSSPTPPPQPFSPLVQPKTAPLRPGSMGARSSSPGPNARSNPGTPALGHPRMRHLSRSCSRTRSRSPAHQMQGPVPGSGALPGSGPNSRRGSSVLRARKTAKELEKEYADMDGDDDELPDDASLWNVPMSPSLYRRASTAVSSTQTSPRGSPERGSRPATPRPSRLRPIDALVAQTTPVESGPRTAPLEQSGKKPVPPQLETRHSNSDHRVPAAVQTPDRFTFGQSRTKSWDTVLSDLSEDAKQLSAALDTFHDQSSQHPHPPRKPDDPNYASTDPMPRTLARARTAPAVELPPLRKNNVMIDPLPISKEKEKVLSRTRPSWLPPKDRKEEKKHLREYQRMMERSQEAEKKRAALALAAATERDATRLALQREWDSQVFPTWSTAIRTATTRELWWRGIPARARPEAWRRGIGNELGVTVTTFEKALARAHAQEQSPRVREWCVAIDADLSVALPQVALFQAGQPLHAAATSLLRAYAMYRSDVGYVTGIALPACLLLLVLGSAPEAFVALANLLNRSMPLAFLTSDGPGMQRVYGWVQELLVKQRPRLAQHIFEAQGLRPDEVLEPLLRSLFLSSSASEAMGSAPSTPLSGTHAPSSGSGADASLAAVLRLWDIFLLDPDAAFVRIAAGVLVANEARLYGTADEIRSVVGWGGELLRVGDSSAVGGRTSSETTTSSLSPSSLPTNGHGNGHQHGSAATAPSPAEPNTTARDRILAQCDALQWDEVVEAVVRHVRDVGRQPAPERNAEDERKRLEKEEKLRRKKENELPWQM